MVEFNRWAGGLPESETLAITAAARRLRASGVSVAPFAAGEPDFDTPAHVKAAAIRAIEEGRTKYGPAAGNAALREQVARTMAAAGLEGLTADRTLIGPGAKGVIYLALQVLLRPGDEVLVPTPCWLSYRQMVQASGARCVFVPTRPEDGFRIDPDRVQAAVTPRTRLLIVNSPGNPTGAVQPDDVLAALGRLAARRGLAVVSDEIYEHLVYEPAVFRSFAALAPDARDLTIVVSGVSKAFAMTGWRIGYAGGPRPWIERMVRLQSHALSGPPEITQAAALAALEGPVEPIAEMRRAFERRRGVMHALLARIPDLVVPWPEGAFYVLPDVSAYLGRTYRGLPTVGATRLAGLLLEHAQVAVVPGEAFEAPYALRFSYACSEEDIRSGMERVRAFFADVCG
jgi:aspartate aminotransferase